MKYSNVILERKDGEWYVERFDMTTPTPKAWLAEVLIFGEGERVYHSFVSEAPVEKVILFAKERAESENLIPEGIRTHEYISISPLEDEDEV